VECEIEKFRKGKDFTFSGNDYLSRNINSIIIFHTDHIRNSLIIKKKSQLGFLSNQINPHFLYNSLESIRGKALLDNSFVVAEMVEALSFYFRYIIDQEKNIVLVEDELRNIDTYLKIQQFRFDNKFQIEKIMVCDESVLRCRIPKLTLQPLIENAIIHGFETRNEKGKIVIRIIETISRITIHVEDDGVGIDQEKIDKINKSLALKGFLADEKMDSMKKGIALYNINKRIKLTFGKQYGIIVYSTIGVGTDVEISIPKTFDKNR
jgi:two-component system sensor histidine kinase YesM